MAAAVCAAGPTTQLAAECVHFWISSFLGRLSQTTSVVHQGARGSQRFGCLLPPFPSVDMRSVDCTSLCAPGGSPGRGLHHHANVALVQASFPESQRGNTYLAQSVAETIRGLTHPSFLRFVVGALSSTADAPQTIEVFVQWLATIIGAPLGPLQASLQAAKQYGEADPVVRQQDLLAAAGVSLLRIPPRDLRRCWKTTRAKFPTPLLALAAAVRASWMCVCVCACVYVCRSGGEWVCGCVDVWMWVWTLQQRADNIATVCATPTHAQLCSLNDRPPSLEEAHLLTSNPAVVKMLVHRTPEAVEVCSEATRVAAPCSRGFSFVCVCPMQPKKLSFARHLAVEHNIRVVLQSPQDVRALLRPGW